MGATDLVPVHLQQVIGPSRQVHRHNKGSTAHWHAVVGSTQS
jgi:hypothetical protein